MLTLFNRKEAAVIYDINEQARMRRLLAAEGLDYSVKTVDRLSASPVAAGMRVRTGTYGQNTDAMTEYIIYVKKADYEKAAMIIHK